MMNNIIYLETLTECLILFYRLFIVILFGLHLKQLMFVKESCIKNKSDVPSG